MSSLNPGGVIMVDDYANMDCPGASHGINDFLRERYADIAEVGFQSMQFVNEGKMVPASLTVLAIVSQ